MNAAIATTRSLSVDLSPPVLYDEGLVEAVHWLAAQMSQQHGLKVDVHAQSEEPVPSADLRVLLFQIVRELLFNVVKHAGVTEAVVALARVDESMHVEVSDRGRGFDVADTTTTEMYSHGLGRGKRRLELIGGRMLVESTPGQGTRVTLECPMRQGAADETGAR